MARRRGRKGKGRKGSKAFPLLMAAPVIPGFVTAYNYRDAGPVEMIRQGVFKISGIDVKGESKFNMTNAMATGTLLIVGIVGHKLASRTGINRIMKKATLGYLQL